ncbi:BTAD domain-containing putative transcriptional regulator [Micromonospora sp. NPDC048935]|uniref:AfsR/SARP family transcriptional regulator n=1 Tax=Micromonospora sp. NPDC048935 TaxID=3364262 RepID=UPI00371E5360
MSLGGIKQRAALGCLLLHANQVVASSTLLGALWSDEDRPASARKILHNAVWRLRGTLPPPDGNGLPRLDTREPGYVLETDPADVDLPRFQHAVTEGRRLLAAGDAGEAADLLGGALRLWRGPVLADLVEQGLHWPELARVNAARLDTQEDWFDAELRCGRHHAILGELQAFVDGAPLRERAGGQLMLALYRCGRQAEALDVYAALRGRLEQLGLEPDPGLRQLQYAILNHDRSLEPPPTPPVTIRLPEPRNVRLERMVTAGAVGRHGGSRNVGNCRTTPPPAHAQIPAQRSAARRPVSLLLARVVPAEAATSERLDEILATTAAGVAAEVAGAGGVVAASLGATTLAVFGRAEGGPDDAERAIRAAAAVRERFGPAAVQAAIATGPLHLPDPDAVPHAITGVLVDDVQRLLVDTEAGEIRLCEATRRATEDTVVASPVLGPDSCWRVRSMPVVGGLPSWQVHSGEGRD